MFQSYMYQSFVVKTFSLDELISYSKLKESPAVTVIDCINSKAEFDYITSIVGRLRLIMCYVKDSDVIALLDNQYIARKIGKELSKRTQVMYYDYSKRPPVGSIVAYALTGYCHNMIIRDNGYKVFAYDELGNEIPKWINTDIIEVPTNNISKYGLSKFKYYLNIRGCSNGFKSALVELSRYHYLNGGVFNYKRHCYYPADTTSIKGEASFNKLEKLFHKWGFPSL